MDIQEADLLRNFVLHHFASPSSQCRVYKQLWLPVERVRGDLDGLRELLEEFL
eukprot:CAMPEP_0204347864 /NCGR_PEP_ID=MMETSP0469-20131031/28291_1 /ASSEMBLY_ACC=CAM_ASM_000384 /TAXON_ID=2969 /ORGANISM="Oxyrrhis marina" /LENGTH=52 /DNA_ID=CAMNT_0051333741 /DNA_START=1 /DNA_END=155 /DNA_ORIENTATION=+